MVLDLRADFPVLRRQIAGRPLLYLDSAASSLIPTPVLDAERAHYETVGANVHRGSHALGDEATFAYESARCRVARFLSAFPDEVVFVRGATEGLNLVATGLGLQGDDVVLVPASEHHANLLPWKRVAQVQEVEGDLLSPVDPDQIRRLLDRHPPRVLAFSMASNVTGVVQPVADLCRLARARGVTTVVDAAQAAPHLGLDVHHLGCDFLTFSGHKLLAPKGIGVLWGRAERLATLRPLLTGGGASSIPQRFEAGTPNVGAAIALAAALDYLEGIGPEHVVAHGERLAAALASAVSALELGQVLMSRNTPRIPLVTVIPRAGVVSPTESGTRAQQHPRHHGTGRAAMCARVVSTAGCTGRWSARVGLPLQHRGRGGRIRPRSRRTPAAVPVMGSADSLMVGLTGLWTIAVRRDEVRLCRPGTDTTLKISGLPEKGLRRLLVELRAGCLVARYQTLIRQLPRGRKLQQVFESQRVVQQFPGSGDRAAEWCMAWGRLPR